MPAMIDLNEAEMRFEELVAEVEAGAAFILCRDGVPIVRLIPVHKIHDVARDGDEIRVRKDDGRR